MTRYDLLDIRAALDKASYWARKQADLFQIIDAKKKVEASLNEHSLPFNLDDAAHSYSESDEPLYSPGHRFHWDNESLFGKQIETTFKAGAEWMAKQHPLPEDSAAFQKGVQEGRRLEREDVKSTIQSRIDEILGDAQPNPILRMELQELIKKIEA